MDKDKKEFIIGSVVLTILILLVIFIILYVLYIKEKDNILTIPESKYNITDYIYIEKVDYSKYNNLFTGNLEIPKITLKNIDENIVNDFENKETDILLEIVNSSKLLKENISDGYNPTSRVNVDMDYKIVNNILSIKYILTIDLDFDLDTIIKPLYLNYDIENRIVLSNTDLLNKMGYITDEVAEYLFNNVIIKEKDTDEKVIDTISNQEVSINDIINNKDEYIKRIIDSIDILYLYVDNDNLSIGYFLNDLINLCYLNNSDNSYNIIKYEKE